MAYPSASKLVIAARAAGYRELPVGNRKVILQTVCPECNNKRMIRFIKEKRVKGPKLIDKCYGCGYKAPVKSTGRAKKAAKCA